MKTEFNFIDKFTKTKLINTTHNNEILSQYFPREFYSNNYTKYNLITKSSNLSRDFESCSMNQNKEIQIELTKIKFFYDSKNYEKGFELIKFYLKNIYIYINNNSFGKYSYSTKKINNENLNSCLELKNKIQILYENQIIIYSVYYNSLKLVELLEDSMENLYTQKDYINSEKTFKRISQIENKSESKINFLN